MAMQAAMQRLPSLHLAYPVFETVSGFGGAVTITSTANSTSLPVIVLDYWSNAMSGASLGGIYRAVYADVEQYDPDFVAGILRADAEPPEAQFNNVVDMLNWLNRD